MNLFKRFIYYIIGVFFGSLVVYFIWKGKDVSFDYGMDARTLKTIRTKKIIYSKNAETLIKQMSIDSMAIQNILRNGDVDFGESNQHKKPCAEYSIHGKHKEQKVKLWIIRCDTLATIDLITTYK